MPIFQFSGEDDDVGGAHVVRARCQVFPQWAADRFRLFQWYHHCLECNHRFVCRPPLALLSRLMLLERMPCTPPCLQGGPLCCATPLEGLYFWQQAIPSVPVVLGGGTCGGLQDSRVDVCGCVLLCMALWLLEGTWLKHRLTMAQWISHCVAVPNQCSTMLAGRRNLQAARMSSPLRLECCEMAVRLGFPSP